MKIYIVMEDLGDGDVALRYFKHWDDAIEYREKYIDYCYYESNPKVLDTENISFTLLEEEE